MYVNREKVKGVKINLFTQNMTMTTVMGYIYIYGMRFFWLNIYKIIIIIIIKIIIINIYICWVVGFAVILL